MKISEVTDKMAIQTKSLEEFIRIRDLISPKLHNETWSMYESETCIDSQGCFEEYDYFLLDGYTIIPSTEITSEEQETPNTGKKKKFEAVAFHHTPICSDSVSLTNEEKPKDYIESFGKEPLQPEFLKFAQMMQHEMMANAHKGEWRTWGDYNSMIGEIEHHLKKLKAGIETPNDGVLIREYAPDIANFCLMLVNCCGWMQILQLPTPAVKENENTLPTFTYTQIEQLQSKVYDIVGKGDVMKLFNELLGIGEN